MLFLTRKVHNKYQNIKMTALMNYNIDFSVVKMEQRGKKKKKKEKDIIKISK